MESPGARIEGSGRCRFSVWAPARVSVAVRLESGTPRLVPLTRDGEGYWSGAADGVKAGDLYRFVLDGDLVRPDPASLSQPQGVHGPSAVVDHRSFTWTDQAWRGVPLDKMVIYELHIGTFTPEGTFDAAIARLDGLVKLGVNTLELMPVAQFPGERNWGYDGAYPFAAQDSYGGVDGLKRLVNAAHQRGLAVILDAVYNHLGPEGNYLGDYGPYFTEQYRTPWGSAVNFDGAHSDQVRRFFLDNARSWLRDFHSDGLRLDAIHGIFDFSAVPFLADLTEAVERLAADSARPLVLIAESDLNDERVLRARAHGGLGLDAQWSDDFHHSLHAALTGEGAGYYADYGGVRDLAVAYNEAFVYAGRYSPFRARRHGNPVAGQPGRRFVVCAQNHDQTGNRMLGERLGALTDFERQKLAAGALLVSPFVPLLFMGEEYGETAPFLYFVSHSDAGLVEAVRAGRKREFAHFQGRGEPPDPQAAETFHRSVLNWELRASGRHETLLEWHRELLRLRTHLPALANLDRRSARAAADENTRVLKLERGGACLSVMNFSDAAQEAGPFPDGNWRKRLDSADTRWDGPGATMPDGGAPGARIPSWSVAIYERV